jgi:hypothetical protein
MLWSEDVGPEVVDQSFSLDFVDGMRQIFVQDGMGTLLGRRLDVPQQLVPRYLQRACSSTHKDSFAMMLLWI